MGYELVTELLPFFAQSCHITKCRKVHKLLLFKCFRSCLPFLLSLSLFYELSLYRFLRESRHSEILIIFAEDSCAVIGLLIALGGTLLSHFTGNPFYDALSGVLIGVLLCTAALFLAREFYSLLIGESVTENDLVRIKTSFNRKEISRLINVKTVHLSPTDILLTAKIDVKSEYEAHSPELINDIERDVRALFPAYNIYIYIETDKYKEDYKR